MLKNVPDEQKKKEILDAIGNLRIDDKLFHKEIYLRLKKIQNTQKEHTEAFNEISEYTKELRD